MGLDRRKSCPSLTHFLATYRIGPWLSVISKARAPRHSLEHAAGGRSGTAALFQSHVLTLTKMSEPTSQPAFEPLCDAANFQLLTAAVFGFN